MYLNCLTFFLKQKTLLFHLVLPSFLLACFIKFFLDIKPQRSREALFGRTLSIASSAKVLASSCGRCIAKSLMFLLSSTLNCAVCEGAHVWVPFGLNFYVSLRSNPVINRPLQPDVGHFQYLHGLLLLSLVYFQP